MRISVLRASTVAPDILRPGWRDRTIAALKTGEIEVER